MVYNVIRAAALGLILAAPVQAQSVAGPYLAARHAAVNSDFEIASRYYTQALTRDRNNVELMESATLSFISLGQLKTALPIAKRMAEAGSKSDAARMVQTVGLIDAEDYTAIQNMESEGRGILPWVDGLLKAWAFVGTGDKAAAMAQFDVMAKEPGIKGFVLYHKALALAQMGDFEAAEAILSSKDIGAAGATRRGVIARAELLSQLDRNDDAILLIDENFGGETDPELDVLLENLRGNAPVPFSHVTSVRDGMAEVYFTFAAVLRTENAGDYYTLLYAQIARHLRPEHIDALLLTAGLLEALEQNDLAIDVYKQVPANHPAYHAAELGRAAALRRSEHLDQAAEVLEQLSRSHGHLPSVHSTLGDLLSRQDKFEDAIKAYDKALSLTPEGVKSRWVLHYARGIAEERSGDWESSETDFRAALAIEPDQPQVLNYLGYSLVEQKRKLDEALEMIERAVAGRPDSGYIVDSLGWVYYRLGRYDEAVIQMERAVELMPVDPVVNDHLGDVYWAVGREREAQFQWSRALSFVDKSDGDTEADPDRIRRKMEVGLDKVLAEEGAPPLKVAKD